MILSIIFSIVHCLSHYGEIMNGNRYHEEEAAPLLAGERLNDDSQTNGDHKPTSSLARNSSIKQRLLSLWRWARNNVRILALVALLTGGVIAMVIFIGRKLYFFSCSMLLAR